MDPSDEDAVREAIEKDRLSVMKAKKRWQKSSGKEVCRDTYRAFCISLGARFGRIRKTTKGTPPPRLYAYNK